MLSDETLIISSVITVCDTSDLVQHRKILLRNQI